ncbi:MAG TPA: RNA 2',3'-cyclic phosphodiesterase [Longimicrobium sp.]|nr:RNA 2',3'-cyclic phosphodiesterase [Longimicrobium sp.]
MADESAGRLFLGVALDDAARREIDAHLRASLAGDALPGRAVPMANWHLTLRFLGRTTAQQAAGVRAATEAADLGSAFTMRFGGLGAFPRPRRASVLWMAVAEGVDRLRALAALAEEAARAAGFAPEDRPYTPHLTLSRLNPPRDVTDHVARTPSADVESRVDGVVLFRSRLGGGPARYEVVDRWGLRAP